MKLGIVMDPIAGIKQVKDTSLAMLLAAQEREWEIHYMEIGDLFLDNAEACASMRKLRVMDNPEKWYEFGDGGMGKLAMLDVILMRKDPPVNMDYIFATQILEIAYRQGVLVVNKPEALRDFNEKLFVHLFPDCIAPTLVSKDAAQINEFLSTHEDIILKPLDRMGGAMVFRVKPGDTNRTVIIETLTEYGQKFAIAQKYIPEISEGDKRILLIDGEPGPHALARVPLAGESRGNLAAGGTGKGMELSRRDREICEKIAPVLKEEGILFAGIDVIGDYLTEINITSPTCIRELDRIYDIDIAGDLMQAIQDKLATR